jgi:ribosomal protein S18 acetylase RimI-like enzyme
MEIIDLKQQDPRMWQETLLRGYAYGPFSWIRKLDEQSRRALLCRDLKRSFEHSHSALLGVSEEPRVIRGFVQLERLDWDSRHFGFDVWAIKHLGLWGPKETDLAAGRTLVEAAVSQAQAAGAVTIHTRIPLDNISGIHALEATGFRVMEVQSLWLFDLTRQAVPQPQSGHVVRALRPDDADEAIALARGAYTDTPDRFHADQHLPLTAADALYADWIRNCTTGEEADYMMVVEAGGHVVGFGTLRYWDDHGGACNVRIGQLLLGAVDPAYREQNINVDVMAGMLRWLKDAGSDLAFVGTQANNISSLISMTKLGWRPVHSALGLHAWLADE